MDSITDVLAQAVYGLHLHDLPLDNLALGQRQRTGSMGRHAAASRRELGPARLSSFSVITEGPPAPATRKAPGGGARSPGKDHVDGGRSLGTSTRGQLYRSATQEEQGSPVVDMPRVKRHSTPVTTGSRPSCTSLLTPITEFYSPEHQQEESSITATKPATVVTPYQPLLEDDEITIEEEDGGAVIANLNARSPTRSPTPSENGVSQPRPLSAGSPTPSQDSVSRPRPLSAGSPTSSQEEARQRGRSGGEGQIKLISKHRSNRAMPPRQNSLGSPVEGRRKKRKWFHTRSDSDSVMANPSAMELGVVSDRSSPSLGSQKPQPFSIRKSSSDGNIHRLGHASSPDTGPEPVSLKDGAAIPFRRVTSIASPISHDTGAATERGVFSTFSSATSDPSRRPLRRSLTVDSPEPTPTGM